MKPLMLCIKGFFWRRKNCETKSPVVKYSAQFPKVQDIMSRKETLSVSRSMKSHINQETTLNFYTTIYETNSVSVFF